MPPIPRPIWRVMQVDKKKWNRQGQRILCWLWRTRSLGDQSNSIHSLKLLYFWPGVMDLWILKWFLQNKDTFPDVFRIWIIKKKKSHSRPFHLSAAVHKSNWKSEFQLNHSKFTAHTAQAQSSHFSHFLMTAFLDFWILWWDLPLAVWHCEWFTGPILTHCHFLDDVVSASLPCVQCLYS